MYVAQPIAWTDSGVVMLDQRRLPGEEISYTYTTYQDIAKAIREMVIRGAPAIGVAAAMGVAIGVQNSSAKSLADLQTEFPLIVDTLAKTRPTAVDLFWALRRRSASRDRPLRTRPRASPDSGIRQLARRTGTGLGLATTAGSDPRSHDRAGSPTEVHPGAGGS